MALGWMLWPHALLALVPFCPTHAHPPAVQISNCFSDGCLSPQIKNNLRRWRALANHKLTLLSRTIPRFVRGSGLPVHVMAIRRWHAPASDKLTLLSSARPAHIDLQFVQAGAALPDVPP